MASVLFYWLNNQVLVNLQMCSEYLVVFRAVEVLQEARRTFCFKCKGKILWFKRDEN